MVLRDIPYEEAQGKFYRREGWGWIDGPQAYNGRAYMNERGQIRFSSDRTSDYNYGFASRDDWYEVDDRGYRVGLSAIMIGGE